LSAFAQCVRDFPDWNLTILGEGAQRSALEVQIAQLRLSGRVSLPGAVNPPFGILWQADLFVCSSRYEGFGMALAEAMACSLPVVSFACPSGPQDIVRHEIDGLLVPAEDVDGLAVAMRRLMADSALRKQFAQRAPEVVARFSYDRVMGQWGDFIEEIMRRQEVRPSRTPSTFDGDKMFLSRKNLATDRSTRS
jgi:glycosyltransferase involved in cell wall biosynthesis